jgi:hypothetical protein
MTMSQSIDSQIGDVADPVAHPGAKRAPERKTANVVSSAKTYGSLTAVAPETS